MSELKRLVKDWVKCALSIMTLSIRVWFTPQAAQPLMGNQYLMNGFFWLASIQWCETN